MTTETTIADRSTIEQTLARLLILQANLRLPAIERLEINPDNHIVTVRLHTGAGVSAWREALMAEAAEDAGVAAGSKASRAKDYDRADGLRGTSCHVWSWHGWAVALDAREPVAHQLDAETVAGLEAVAGQPKHIPTERVDAILAELNRITADGDNWWDWIHDEVPEFDGEATANSDGGVVCLIDGTDLIWHEYAKSWTVAGGSR